MGSLPATRLPDSGSTSESLCSEARRELTQPPPQSITLRLRPTAAGDTALTPTNQKGRGCGGSRESSPPKVSVGHCVEWGFEGKAVWTQVLRLQDKVGRESRLLGVLDSFVKHGTFCFAICVADLNNVNVSGASQSTVLF